MPATPSPKNPAGDDQHLVPADATNSVSFGDRLQLFWEKNGGAILALCALVIVGVLAKGLWEYFARQKQIEIAQAYANATSPEQLKSFTSAHPDQFLAGIAQMRLADEAYQAGKYSEAASGYDQALAAMGAGPLASRVRLGRAVANVQAGRVTEGSAELKELLDDANQLRAIRTEAGYHLASMAADSGNSAEVQAISDRLMQIDPSSLWTQRALTLRANMPVSMPAAPAEAPAPSNDAPSVQLKLPGK